MISALSRFIYFKLMGWKVVGDFPSRDQQYVIIGAPHTSNFDFILGLLIKLGLRVPINFFGKKSLFVFPFGYFFKAVGGIPVNRSRKEKMVDYIVRTFKEGDLKVLAVSPEGTRSKVTEWKTGFYHIAKQANLPVVAITFDYGNKQVRVYEPYQVTEDMQNDIAHFKSLYYEVQGRNPENGVTPTS